MADDNKPKGANGGSSKGKSPIGNLSQAIGQRVQREAKQKRAGEIANQVFDAFTVQFEKQTEKYLSDQDIKRGVDTSGDDLSSALFRRTSQFMLKEFTRLKKDAAYSAALVGLSKPGGIPPEQRVGDINFIHAHISLSTNTTCNHEALFAACQQKLIDRGLLSPFGNQFIPAGTPVGTPSASPASTPSPSFPNLRQSPPNTPRRKNKSYWGLGAAIGGGVVATGAIAGSLGLFNQNNKKDSKDRRPDATQVAKNEGQQKPLVKPKAELPKVDEVKPPIVPTEKPLENPMAEKPVEKPVEKPLPMPMAEEPVPVPEKPMPPMPMAEKPVPMPEKPAEKPMPPMPAAEKPAEKPAAKPPVPAALPGKGSPVGLEEKELREYFEKHVITDLVAASPHLVDRGFVNKKDDGYEIANHYRLSYLTPEDVTQGIYVLSDNKTGSTLIVPPANRKVSMAVVASAPHEGDMPNRNYFHISVLSDGKEKALKDQKNRPVRFPMPERIRNQNKFLTGEDIFKGKMPGLEFAAWYTDRAERAANRTTAMESPHFSFLTDISGLALALHAGVVADFRNTMLLNVLTRYPLGLGNPADTHLLILPNEAEPGVIIPSYAITMTETAIGKVGKNLAGNLDMVDHSLYGMAVPLPLAGIQPSDDSRTKIDSATNARGHAYLYIHMPIKNRVAARMNMRFGNQKPLSLFSGQVIGNQQNLRAKDFIKAMDDMLPANEETFYSLAELSRFRMVAQRQLATAAQMANELKNVHGADLMYGSYNQYPSLTENKTIYRYTSNIDAIHKAGEPATTLDIVIRSAQALERRSITEAGHSRKKAEELRKEVREEQNAAKKLKLEMDKLEKKISAKGISEEDKEKLSGELEIVQDDWLLKLGEAYAKESEAARILGVPYPEKIVKEDEPPVKKKKYQALEKARQSMDDLLKHKDGEAMLNYYLKGWLKAEQQLNDPTIERGVEVDDAAAMHKWGKDMRRGLAALSNQDILSHLDRYTGHSDKPWERS